MSEDRDAYIYGKSRNIQDKIDEIVEEFQDAGNDSVMGAIDDIMDDLKILKQNVSDEYFPASSSDKELWEERQEIVNIWKKLNEEDDWDEEEDDEDFEDELGGVDEEFDEEEDELEEGVQREIDELLETIRGRHIIVLPEEKWGE